MIAYDNISGESKKRNPWDWKSSGKPTINSCGKQWRREKWKKE
jgi:hypothetical protein